MQGTAAAVVELARLISETLDPGEVAQRVVDSLQPLFDARAVVLLAAQDNGDLVELAAAGDPGEALDRPMVLPRGTGFLGLAARERTVVETPNTLADPRVEYPPELRARLAQLEHRAILAVPLLVRDDVVGVLGIADREGRVFTPEEIVLAQALAGLVAVALANARLHDAAVRRFEREKAAREHAERIEETLRLNEERYRAIVESSIQGVLVHTDGIVRFANPALARMMGYATPDEVVGMQMRDFVAPSDRDRLARYRAARARNEPAPTRYEVQAVRRDGTSVWLDCFVARTMWDGASANLVALIDITERKGLEERLAQAQKMEAIGRLAGGIAHDFNNLLTVITGRTDLLLESLPEGDPGHGDAALIQRTAQRAASLTRQLLAFARRQTLQPRVLDLNAVVSALVPMLQRLIGEDVLLDFAPGADVGPVRADPGQLEQVIVNLAVNARDAMERGGRLTLETANANLDAEYARRNPDVEPGAYVVLTVADTGVGMDEPTLSRIFEPFFTTKTQGRGTGLGLATVYGIVRQSGGHIWVYSEPRQGTVFKISLPRAVTAPAAAAPAPAPAPPPRGRETVLLVEDDDDVRALGRQVLQRQGYTVLEARNGAAALALAGRHAGPLHLLVTDVVMQGMSGRELAERLAVTRPDTRVLYASGYTDDGVVRRGVLEATMAFIQKPFTPDALTRKVREVLDG